MSLVHRRGSSSSSSSDTRHNQQSSMFFPSSYDPSSSFQMNPLSAHPPRTPRPSLIGGSHQNNYSQEMFHAAEESQEKPPVPLEDSVDGEGPVEIHDAAKESALSNVRGTEIWREIFKTSNGRDKAFKLMQYSIRLWLLAHGAVNASGPFQKRVKTAWEVELVRRLDRTASGLSITRKCLIMFNWLTPLATILNAQPLEFSLEAKSKEPPRPLLHSFLHAPPPVLLDLVNGLSDDIYALHRLGLVGRRVGDRAAHVSNWCWFVGTLIALVELGFERNVTKGRIQAVESKIYAESMNNPGNANSYAMQTAHKELDKLRKQDFWLKVQRTKLLMDLIFVSYDIFKIRYAPDIVKTLAALASAMLSSAKLYQNHRNTLAVKQANQ